MDGLQTRVRKDLAYREDPDREGYWFVTDLFWGRTLSFNELQVTMMRALDGTHSLVEVRQILGNEFGQAIPIAKIESFVQRLARDLLLDDAETRRKVERLLALPVLPVAEVAKRLGESGFHVVDANGEERWRRVHIPGARPLSPYYFERHELPDDTSSTIVFYCAKFG